MVERAQDVIQAVELGRLVSRGRQQAMRERRLPGLGLLLLGAGRGRVEAVAAHLPVLPWAAKISGVWIQEAAPQASSPGPVAAVAERHTVSFGPIPSIRPALAPSFSPAPVVRSEPSEAPGDVLVTRAEAFEAERAAERPAAAGLESVAPSLVLLRRGRVPSSEAAVAVAGPLRALRPMPPVHPEVRPILHERAAAPAAPSAPSQIAPSARAEMEAEAPTVEPLESDIIPLPVRAPALGAPEIAGSIRAFVEEEVKEQIQQAAAERPAPAEPPSPPAPRSAQPARGGLRATRAADDEARDLLKRMRALAQEERFRSGKIR